MSSSRFAAMLALVLSVGCQFVFGIDEYQPGAPGSGSSSSSGGSAGEGGDGGGDGARGGEGGNGNSSLGGSGTGGACECADADGWTYVAFDKATPADQAPESECNGLPRLNLFGGVEASCSDCISTPTAECSAPGLRCFNGGCGGAATDYTAIGAGCTNLNAPTAGFDNCQMIGPPTGAACSTPPAATPSRSVGVAASFCGGCNYCLAEVATCIVHDSTVPVAECEARGFPEVYELHATPDGTPSCSACEAPVGDCSASAYEVGTFNCDDMDIRAECDGQFLGLYFGRFAPKTNCSAAPATASFTYSSPARTVCCKAGTMALTLPEEG